MPASGEEPITSFFSRAASSSQRKETVRPTSHSAKRKRNVCDAGVNDEPPLKKGNVQRSPVHREKARRRINDAQRRLEDRSQKRDGKENTSVISRTHSAVSDQLPKLHASRTSEPPTPNHTAAVGPKLTSSGCFQRAIQTPKCYEVIDLTETQNGGYGSALHPSPDEYIHGTRSTSPTAMRRISPCAARHSLQTPPQTYQLKRKKFSDLVEQPHPPLAPFPFANPHPPTSPRNPVAPLPTPRTICRPINQPRPSCPRKITIPTTPTKSRQSVELVSPWNRTPSPLSSLPADYKACDRHNDGSGLRPSEDDPMCIEFSARHKRASADTDNSEADMGRHDDPFILPVHSQLVPSSQSLDVNFPWSPRSATSSSPIAPTVPATSSPMFKLPALPIHRRQPTVPATDSFLQSDCRFVASSQTQLMLPFDSSPRRIQVEAKPFHSTTFLLDGDSSSTINEFVQSSQTQIENDVTMGMGISQFLSCRTNTVADNPSVEPEMTSDNQETDGAIIRSQQSLCASPLPASSFPGRSSFGADGPSAQMLDFSDLFEDDVGASAEADNQPSSTKYPKLSQGKLPRITNALWTNNKQPEDSATESDDDDEMVLQAAPSKSNKMQPHCIPTNSQHSSRLSRPFGSHASPSRTSYIPNSDCSSEVDFMNTGLSIPEDFASGIGTITSEDGTLPSVVKDFCQMFDGEGSYPDDFPLSLQ